MIYTVARVGAVAKLKVKNLEHDGMQWCLRFDEKGSKSRLYDRRQRKVTRNIVEPISVRR